MSTSLSTQIIVDDELLEYEVGQAPNGASLFQRGHKHVPKARVPDFHVIHDCPRPRSQSLSLGLPSVPVAVAKPVEAGPFVESSSKQYLDNF